MLSHQELSRLEKQLHLCARLASNDDKFCCVYVYTFVDMTVYFAVGAGMRLEMNVNSLLLDVLTSERLSSQRLKVLPNSVNCMHMPVLSFLFRQPFKVHRPCHA